MSNKIKTRISIHRLETLIDNIDLYMYFDTEINRKSAILMFEDLMKRVKEAKQ